MSRVSTIRKPVWRLVARTALPAVAGIGLGMGIFHQGGSGPGVAGETGPKSGARRTEARPAPERDGPLASADPQAALLAAYGGRTKEAKRHLEELLATAETTDAEIARWLAPVLIEEPGYLEIFLKRLTPERGRRLTCETLFQMDRVDARALWTLVRTSPPALAAMHGWTDPAVGLERNDKGGVDDLLAHSEGREEALLDPAYGFRDAELREGCWKLKDAESLGKLLELSKLGRLEEAEAGLPDWLLRSLGEVSQSDPAGYAGLLEKMSPEQRQVMQAQEALARLAEAKTPPTLADLQGQDADWVDHATQLWRDRGQPLALATLAELPPESRGAALKHYFDNGTEGIGDEQMAGLDGLALSVEEKSALLATGAQARWQREADGAAALDWIQRIPDRAAWPGVTREVIEGYARLDPQAALDYAQNSMPDGPLREQLEQAANAALP